MTVEGKLVSDAIEARLVELEVRSEERRADTRQLEEFVGAFETRIRSLEKQVDALKTQLENPPEELPPSSEDLPPHY
jgi:uncharacterized coiled-coil protein SlyX